MGTGARSGESRGGDHHRIMARQLLLPASERQPWVAETTFRLPYLRAMERARNRLRFLHNVLLRPTPLEWEAVPLPPALAPLYYLIRPMRLFWKYARGTVSVATGSSQSP